MFGVPEFPGVAEEVKETCSYEGSVPRQNPDVKWGVGRCERWQPSKEKKRLQKLIWIKTWGLNKRNKKRGVSWKADRNTGTLKKRTWWKTERGNVLFHKISRGAAGQGFQFTSALEEVGGARPWVQEFPGLEREFKFRMNCVDGTSTKQQKTNYKGNHVRLNLELWQTEAHHSLNPYRSRSQQTRQWEILS